MGVFSNNAITDRGRILLADAQVGAVFEATKIVMGSGSMPSGATAASMTAVVTPVIELAINKKKRAGDGTVTYGGMYNNESITEAFYFRELGLYARVKYADGSYSDEVLYSYGNAGSSADLMPAYGSGTVVEKQMDLVVYVGNETEVDLTIASGLYIPTDEKGEPFGVATLGEDGKVPEEQLPEMDYAPSEHTHSPGYTVASTNAELVSGETLETAFGKIAKAIKSLISHLADSVSHITSAERTAWNAKAAGTHNHAASEITSGTLAVARGGTGNASVDTTPTSGSTKMVTSGGVYNALSGKAASSHNQAASTITAGTFAGQVVANSSAQTYSTYLLRNTRLASSDTTPTVNGQICWTYE